MTKFNLIITTQYSESNEIDKMNHENIHKACLDIDIDWL
jgi:hypothetical protein